MIIFDLYMGDVLKGACPLENSLTYMIRKVEWNEHTNQSPAHNVQKHGKNYHFKCVFGRKMYLLPQRLKSTFFEIFFSLRVLFGNPPLEFFSKNIYFSL